MKLPKLSKYLASMLIDSRAFMSKFVSSVEETIVKEYKTTMLIKEMNISKLVTHAQLIEKEKVK